MATCISMQHEKVSDPHNCSLGQFIISQKRKRLTIHSSSMYLKVMPSCLNSKLNHLLIKLRFITLTHMQLLSSNNIFYYYDWIYKTRNSVAAICFCKSEKLIFTFATLRFCSLNLLIDSINLELCLCFWIVRSNSIVFHHCDYSIMLPNQSNPQGFFFISASHFHFFNFSQKVEFKIYLTVT